MKCKSDSPCDLHFYCNYENSTTNCLIHHMLVFYSYHIGLVLLLSYRPCFAPVTYALFCSYHIGLVLPLSHMPCFAPVTYALFCSYHIGLALLLSHMPCFDSVTQTLFCSCHIGLVLLLSHRPICHRTLEGKVSHSYSIIVESKRSIY